MNIAYPAQAPDTVLDLKFACVQDHARSDFESEPARWNPGFASVAEDSIIRSLRVWGSGEFSNRH